VIAGPIATALAGAGGLAGGIIGALFGWGIPEERAKHYESDLKDGGIVLGVIPSNDEDATYSRAWSSSRTKMACAMCTVKA
jgi:hypothetical protein